MKNTKNNILLVLKAKSESKSLILNDLRERGQKDSELYKGILHELMAIDGVIALFENKQYFNDMALIYRDKIDIANID